MNIIEYFQKKVEILSHELEEIELQISKIPEIDDINIEQYGNKRELSKKVKKEKGFKIKRIFARQSTREIRKYIHQKEVENLVLKQKKIKRAIDQLVSFINSFNVGNKSFAISIFPNDIIIKALLEYSKISEIGYDNILDILIKLFKSVGQDKKSLLSKIEHDIGDQFDDDLNIIEGVSSNTLAFTFDKLMRVAVGADYDSEFKVSISALEVELKLREQLEDSQEKRDSLIETQNAIKELKEYILGERIIKVAPSTEYFEGLLTKAGINKIAKQQYVSKMNELIKEREEKENSELIKKFLSEDEQSILEKAKREIDKTTTTDLQSLLERLIKDIISICKYMDMMFKSEEMVESYELLVQKIETLKVALREIKKGTNEEHVFCYTTNGNNVPTALVSVETIDDMLYGEILESLSKLAQKSTENKLICQAEGLQFKAQEGRNISIIYVEYNKSIIIISCLANHLLRTENLSITPSTLDSVRNAISSMALPEFHKVQAIYEDLIIQTLDLKTITDDNSYYTLKKDNKNKS